MQARSQPGAESHLREVLDLGAADPAPWRATMLHHWARSDHEMLELDRRGRLRFLRAAEKGEMLAVEATTLDAQHMERVRVRREGAYSGYARSHRHPEHPKGFGECCKRGLDTLIEARRG